MDRTFFEIPVNLTQAREDLVVHAAMPGAEPENILITIERDMITLHSSARGRLGKDKVPLLQEWHIGKYHRVLKLPYSVDSKRANATYNNGVLTVSLPRSEHPTASRQIRVKKVNAERGQTRGHSGQS